MDNNMNDVTEHRHASRDFWHPESRVHTEDFDGESCEERKIAAVEKTVLESHQMVSRNKFEEIILRHIDRKTRWGNIGSVYFDGWSLVWDPISNEYQYVGESHWRVTQNLKVALDAIYQSARVRDLLVWFDHSLSIDELDEIDWNPYAMDWEYPDESVDRDDYYDLIQLPSGGHIPAPFIDWSVVPREQIPTSGIVRDDEYFTCFRCGDVSFYKCYCYDEDEAETSIEQTRQTRKDEEFENICDRAAWDELLYINAV